MSKMIAYELVVHGTVQGVGFRYYTSEKARSLGINGQVWNESNGTVRINMEGDRSSVRKMLQWCHKGPPSSEVLKLEYNPKTVKGFQDFAILRF